LHLRHSHGKGLSAHLFIRVTRPGDSEVTFSRTSSQVATSHYHSNHSKDRGNPVKCLAQGHNKRACKPIFTLSLFYAERQAGKL